MFSKMKRIDMKVFVGVSLLGIRTQLKNRSTRTQQNLLSSDFSKIFRMSAFENLSVSILLDRIHYRVKVTGEAQSEPFQRSKIVFCEILYSQKTSSFMFDRVLNPHMNCKKYLTIKLQTSRSFLKNISSFSKKISFFSLFEKDSL